jgi:hypothetical protein
LENDFDLNLLRDLFENSSDDSLRIIELKVRGAEVA